MEERYIFNYRLRPDSLARFLPVPWLEPQEINGWSVVSFCILKLSKITMPPIPNILGLRTLSCAYRIGVIDTSGRQPEPSVYITDRNADLPIIARLAPFLFLDTIPVVDAAIGHAGDNTTHVQLSYTDGKHLFSAEMTPRSASAALDSEVFESVADFAGFIKRGVSSYTPAIARGAYAKVDLAKEDVGYTPMDATIEYSMLDSLWHGAGLTFDSAVFATGATYTWTYRGLWPR
jgi:hypothetical protein